MLKYKLLLVLIFAFRIAYTQDTISPKDSIIAEEVEEKTEDLYEELEAFPVVIENDTIFDIYEKGDSESLSEQAEVCAGRISGILDRDFYYRDSIAIVDSTDYVIINYSGETIVEFSDKTVELFDKDVANIGEYYANRLGDYLDGRGPKVLKEKIYRVLTYIAIYLVSLILLMFLYKQIKKWFINHDTIIYKITRKLKIYGLQEEDKEKASHHFFKIIKWFYWTIIALFTYMVLPMAFSVFYFTKEIGDQMFGYILDPFFNFIDGFINYIPTIIEIIVIVVIFKGIIKLISYIFTEIEDGNIRIEGFYTEWAKTTGNIIKVFLYAFLLAIVFPLLPGAESDSFKGVSMFIGLVLSLGSTSLIANALSGIIMTYMRPFKVGDRIEADTVTGIVVQRNLLVTRVRTQKNVIVTIPNSKILSSHSENYTTAAERSNLIIHTSVTIGYDVDWRQVHKLLKDAAKKTNGLIETMGKEPFVLQSSLDDYYVAYELNAYTAMADKYPVILSDLHQNILDEFNMAGVEIMSPHYRANRSGEDITIPDNMEEVIDSPDADDTPIEEKDYHELDINERINLRAQEEEKNKDEDENDK
ncbi:MAG: mechanosensitive ion channel domain-containing protein [Bacteroidota bacterium]